MTVTQLQARTEVRALLDETTAAFWTDAQLNSWINAKVAPEAEAKKEETKP